jgi:hypothetical protein
MVTRLLPLPRPIAGLGALVLGLVWSMSSAWMHWPAIENADVPLAKALLLVTAGGTLTVCGVWLGMGAVVWAMARLLGARLHILHALLALSAAAPPLWLALPATLVAIAMHGNVVQRLPAAMLSLLCVAAFLLLLAATLRRACDFHSWQRAWGCVALTGLFCASYVSLSMF